MTHPYMPLYVDDYEAATAHLTAEEDGIYSRLLRLCWRTPGCSLPNDDAWIARKIRLSAADFAKVAKPVIEEFFIVQRGRLVQKRLKAEYENISRKKSARVNAGKKGGVAKALKTKETAAGNATILPAHTRAVPEPEPEPEEEKPLPLNFAPLSRLLAISSGGSFSDLTDHLHLAQPKTAGKRKTTRPDVEKAAGAALKRGARPTDLIQAFRAYYALPDCRKDEGRFSMGAKVLLANDRWREFLPDTVVEAVAKPAAPLVIARRLRHWQDTGSWDSAWGPKPDTPANDSPAPAQRGAAA